MKDHDNDS
jgi:hypothetical protein